jgi:hypothetical protein
MTLKDFVAASWLQLANVGLLPKERTHEASFSVATAADFAKPHSAVGVVLDRPEKTG